MMMKMNMIVMMRMIMMIKTYVSVYRTLHSTGGEGKMMKKMNIMMLMRMIMMIKVYVPVRVTTQCTERSIPQGGG